MARCRGCHAEIGFVRLRSGRLMPVESEEPEEYRVWLEEPKRSLVMGERRRQLALVVDGEVLRVWQVTVEHADRTALIAGPARIVGVEPHWATCPNAREFRR